MLFTVLASDLFVQVCLAKLPVFDATVVMMIHFGARATLAKPLHEDNTSEYSLIILRSKGLDTFHCRTDSDLSVETVNLHLEIAQCRVSIMALSKSDTESHSFFEANMPATYTDRQVIFLTFSQC